MKNLAELLQESYISVRKRVIRSRQNIEIFKLIVVIFIFIFSIGVYGYFTNINSTKGYFLRQIKQKLNKTQIEFEIIKLEVLNKETKVLNEIVMKN